MTTATPTAIAAAADLLAIYGIIEVRSQPVLSAGVLAAAGATIFLLCLGLGTGWQVPPLPMPPDTVLY